MILFDGILIHASNHDQTIIEFDFDESIYFIIMPICLDLYIIFEQNAIAILQEIFYMPYVFILIHFGGIGGLTWDRLCHLEVPF